MPEIIQYTLTHKELLKLLIQENGVHEGRWSLLIGMAVAAGMYGPNPAQTFPGAAITFNQIGIQRFVPGESPEGPGSIILDAAVVNPKPKPSKASKAKRKR